MPTGEFSSLCRSYKGDGIGVMNIMIKLSIIDMALVATSCVGCSGQTAHTTLRWLSWPTVNAPLTVLTAVQTPAPPLKGEENSPVGIKKNIVYLFAARPLLTQYEPWQCSTEEPMCIIIIIVNFILHALWGVFLPL